MFPKAGLEVNGEEGRKCACSPLGDVSAEEEAKQPLVPQQSPLPRWEDTLLLIQKPATAILFPYEEKPGVK